MGRILKFVFIYLVHACYKQNINSLKKINKAKRKKYFICDKLIKMEMITMLKSSSSLRTNIICNYKKNRKIIKSIINDSS